MSVWALRPLLSPRRRLVRRSQSKGVAWRRSTLVGVTLAVLTWLASTLRISASAEAAVSPCPPDMVQVTGYCIDRYEMSLVDQRTGTPLSPYYPPERRWLQYVYDTWERLRQRVGSDAARAMPLPPISEFQREQEYIPAARSRPQRVPQGYLSFHTAQRACEAASKRLCTEQEWETACRGEDGQPFPYGDKYRAGACNVGSYHHPAAVLHGLSSSGHLDPRLNLLRIAADAPVLRLTGASQACASRWGADAIYDMVGNVDEWVDDPGGVFRGGFYARRTTSGCEARIQNHSSTYFSYSTGARCCRDAAR